MRGIMKAVDAAGGWEALAGLLGVQAATIRRWIREGAMPLRYADVLQMRFGIRVESNRKDHAGLALFEHGLRRGLDPLWIRRALGITDQTFRHWRRNGRVPPRRAAEIEKLIERYGR